MIYNDWVHLEYYIYTHTEYLPIMFWPDKLYETWDRVWNEYAKYSLANQLGGLNSSEHKKLEFIKLWLDTIFEYRNFVYAGCLDSGLLE